MILNVSSNSKQKPGLKMTSNNASSSIFNASTLQGVTFKDPQNKTCISLSVNNFIKKMPRKVHIKIIIPGCGASPNGQHWLNIALKEQLPVFLS